MDTKEEQLGLELEVDWESKEIYLSQLFSPTAPILEAEMFSGRKEEMLKLIDAVFQRGQHAVVFGFRGVGKSSLINTFNVKIMPKAKTAIIFPVQCMSDDDFYEIWARAFDGLKYEGTDKYISDDIDSAIDPHAILKICRTIPISKRPIFVFDEFDRIDDADTKERMAETIKLPSDVSPNTTIILAGIADTIQDLLDHHLSVQRSVRQVEIPKMSPHDIKEIVTKRLTLAGMTITDHALKDINNLSKGMPGYAQLLGLYSGKEAIKRKSKQVVDSDVNNCITKCLEDAGSTIREQYANAVQSTHANSNYEVVLLACASCKQDEFGRFSASDVIGPLSAFLGRDVILQDFNRHLKAFASKRGPLLRRKGTQGNYKYAFIEPRMQSYALMTGVKKGAVVFLSEDSEEDEI